MQYSQEHLKTMVYAEFGGQTECIMGNSKIENISLYPDYVTARFLRSLRSNAPQQLITQAHLVCSSWKRLSEVKNFSFARL